ncbi:MAG: peptidyl-prolyl cis-trans isomerase, partial [Fidelibacterota bacterium]
FLESQTRLGTPVSSADVASYYQNNKSMFIRNTDEARIYHFVLPTMKEARSVFRTLSTRKSGAQRRELFTTYRVDAITVKKGYLLPDLDDLLFRSRTRAQVLGPVQTGSGYHVIEVLERHSKGSQKSLNEVYDEIYQRLISEKRALANLRTLDSLRLNTHIEVLMENINDR